MASKTIGVVLSLRDQMSSGLLKINKNVQGVSKETKRASQQVANFATKAQKGFEKAGDKVMKVGLGLATLAGGLIVKTGVEGLGELDQGARKVKSIAQDSLQLKGIQQGLLKTSNDTGIVIKELSDTQYDAISSGVKANESIQAAVTSAKLAKAGFSDSNSSLKILTSTMNVYGLTGQKAMQSISDKLLVTQNLGVTTVAELANSLGSLTPIAKSAGSSIDEMLAGMASLTKNGLKTEEAVTALKGVFSSVIKPTEEASKTAQQLGIDFSASALKSKGFAKFLEEIKTKTGGNTETMGKLFGNVRALSGALVLTGKGFGDFNTSLDAMKNSAGLTDKAFEVMNNSLISKFGKMKNRLKNMSTELMQGTGGQIGVLVDNVTEKLKQWQENGTIEQIANNVATGFMKMYDVISKVIGFLIEHKDAIANFAIVFLSLYSAIKIVNLLKTALFGVQIVMGLLNGTLMLTPIGWLTLGIATLIGGFLLLYKNSETFRNAIGQIGQYIMSNVLPVFQQMYDFFVTNILPVLIQIGTFIMSNILPILQQLGSFLIGTLGIALQGLWQILTQIWTGIIVPLYNFFVANILPILQFIGTIILWLISNVLMPLASFLLGTLLSAFQNSFQFIFDIVSTIVGAIGDVFQGLLTILDGIITFVLGVFLNDWGMAWEGVKKIFTGIWESLGGIVKGILNGMIDGINWVIRGINSFASFKVPDWVPGVGGKSFNVNIPQVSKFAKGTQYSPAGMALINEEGGELRKLSSGETIIPADKSRQLMSGNLSPEINIYITGNVGTEEFFNQAGEHITNQIKLALQNM